MMESIIVMIEKKRESRKEKIAQERWNLEGNGKVQ